VTQDIWVHEEQSGSLGKQVPRTEAEPLKNHIFSRCSGLSSAGMRNLLQL